MNDHWCLFFPTLLLSSTMKGNEHQISWSSSLHYNWWCKGRFLYLLIQQTKWCLSSALGSFKLVVMVNQEQWELFILGTSVSTWLTTLRVVTIPRTDDFHLINHVCQVKHCPSIYDTFALTYFLNFLFFLSYKEVGSHKSCSWCLSFG